jgi:hypothetical protein
VPGRHWEGKEVLVTALASLTARTAPAFAAPPPRAAVPTTLGSVELVIECAMEDEEALKSQFFNSFTTSVKSNSWEAACTRDGINTSKAGNRRSYPRLIKDVKSNLLVWENKRAALRSRKFSPSGAM